MIADARDKGPACTRRGNSASFLTMSLLAGKVAVITGSSRGIGRGCALKFAEHGVAGLVLHYYGDNETTAEANGLKAHIQMLYSEIGVVTVGGDIGNSNTSREVCSSTAILARLTVD